MHLKIKHQSIYRYDRPVAYALQRLRLTPKSCAVQTVSDWQVTCLGAHSEVSYNDGYNNKVELIRHERNATEIVLTAEGTVITTDNTGVFGHDTGSTPVGIFLRESPLTTPGQAITALSAKIAAIPNELDQMHALKEALHAQMTFDAGATDATTPAETSLVAGHGVCQDYAHIFIAAARTNGIPARYISGYLMIPGVEEQVASHAWAEAYVTGLGWVGFDAANNVCPNEHYVRIAAGLDYRDAAPVSGIRMGEGNEKLAVNLKVEQ